jgi:hypothetical protein
VTAWAGLTVYDLLFNFFPQFYPQFNSRLSNMVTEKENDRLYNGDCDFYFSAPQQVLRVEISSYFKIWEVIFIIYF